ncbi:type I restriction enzyme HsdR N-terminal domain-containing protein [Salinigranum salinum]|uniref:type I restriction enzyme HsdR N-terminal domain-containing protein n=1 Tax=Salinigranum salinum TaxID=1364937 RepID=UPI001863B366|nr:type I restriction enzyme HsdR N-terminal domain-containing protein [Salinigranum salinum]
MAQPSQDNEFTEYLIQFYRENYDDEIDCLTNRYPHEQRSLYVDYDDLHAFDSDLAEDYLTKPIQMQRYAEKALRLYDLPADVSLDQAHVRLTNVPEESTIEPGNVRVDDDLLGKLVTVRGYVDAASDVDASVTEAAFECQRCGTMTYLPQHRTGFQEPHECQGCERQGPFDINYDKSEFIDRQTATLVPLPEADVKANGELQVVLEDDIAGQVATGDRVSVIGVLHIGQEESKTMYNTYLDGVSISKLAAENTGLYSGPYLDTPKGEVDSEALEKFVQRSVAVLRTQTLNEMETQSKVITPFLRLLGWSVYHLEFRFEYSDSEVGGDKVDYGLLDQDETPVFVVEAKQEGKNLDLHFKQIKKYMRLFQVQLGLLTNGERYVFFSKDPDASSASELVLLDCKLQNLPNHRDVLAAYTQESVVGGHTSLDELVQSAKEREKSEGQFDADAFRQTSPEDRDTLDAAKSIISDIDADSDLGAPIERVFRQFESELDLDREEAEELIHDLRVNGKIYEPHQNHLRTT